MRDVNVNITSTGFPSQFVSDSEKKTDEFGLQVGQAIQYEWFKKDGNQCRFYRMQCLNKKEASIKTLFRGR